MKKFVLLTLMLCLAIGPALALADGTLRAEGTSTLSVEPDQALLSVGCAMEHAESSVAQQRTADALAAVIDAVKALGIEESDIATSSFNIYPTYNYNDPEPTVRGYRVEHMLSIVVKDLDTMRVGDVMDAALKAGANQAYGINFFSSKEKEVYLQALTQAVTIAAAKADALAIASGLWLGALEQVNELSPMGYYPMSVYSERAEDQAAGSIGNTIMKGELKVTATVELVYAVR